MKIKHILQAIGNINGGDDWNDVPYEHNAETPYDHYYENDVKKEIELKELYFEFPYEWIKLPCDNYCNSPYSIKMINRGDRAWIRGDKFNIQAKTTYEDFIKIVEENNGICYFPKKNSNTIEQMDNEKEYIKTLIHLRDETKSACECSILSMSEKNQWYKDVEALNWALKRLRIDVKK